MSGLNTLTGNLSYPYLFESQGEAKPQNFKFLQLGAVQTLTSRISWVNNKTKGHILWPNVMATINTCVYNRLGRFLMISPLGEKVKGGGKKFPPKAWRLSFLSTITSLDNIKNFLFPHQSQHFLLAKTVKHYSGFLLTTDCKC